MQAIFRDKNLREKFSSVIGKRAIGGGPEKFLGGKGRYTDIDIFVDTNDEDLWKKYKPNEMKEPMITRSDIPGSVPYAQLSENFNMKDKDVKHIGQRKTGLTELHFLTENLDSRYERALVIYVGSAPSMKQGLLSKMFPGVQWVMVDANEFLIFHQGNRKITHYDACETNEYIYMSVKKPNHNNIRYRKKESKKCVHYREGRFDKKNMEHDMDLDDDFSDYIISSKSKFFFFEEYMDKTLSERFNPLVLNYPGKVFVWSDVRLSPSDHDVLADNAMFYTWIKCMTLGCDGKDIRAMYKFRFPFLDEPVDFPKRQKDFDEAKELGVDFTDVSNDKSPFFPGKIYLQPWAKFRSTETRLWCDKDDLKKIIMYDMIEHESIMSFFNRIMRHQMSFINLNADESLGFDHCWDCAMESHIISRFREKHAPTWDVIRTVKDFCRVGDQGYRPIDVYPHGGNFPQNAP